MERLSMVEPFNGAAIGTRGEIRDRMAGGRGSLPMAGSAVYITSYLRLQGFGEREWLYQSPQEITKASKKLKGVKPKEIIKR